MRIRRAFAHPGERKPLASENKAGSTTADVDARSWAEGWQAAGERPRILLPTAKARVGALTPPPEADAASEATVPEISVPA